MSVAEFRLWRAFDRHLEPFGREWQQIWRLIAVLAKKPDGSVPREDECTPLIPPPLTREELEAKLARVMGR
jgi:hypothetical protein